MGPYGSASELADAKRKLEGSGLQAMPIRLQAARGEVRRSSAVAPRSSHFGGAARGRRRRRG
jgi:hypothetical protein